MQVTYQSKNFNEDDIVEVYIAYDVYGTTLKQYDVNANNMTIRESVISCLDYDESIVKKAFDLRMQAFKQVKVK